MRQPFIVKNIGILNIRSGKFKTAISGPRAQRGVGKWGHHAPGTAHRGTPDISQNKNC